MQSNNNKMNTNDDFKVVSKRGKKVIVAAIIPTITSNAPIILCDHCQRPGHKIEKCFQRINELANLEKLKTTVCVYCRDTGHDNKNCPVSIANAEKKRIKAEIWKLNMDQAKEIQLQKDVKYATDFPSVLSRDDVVVPEQLKFAWASVAMANRDPEKLKKMEEENAVAKEMFKKQEYARRVKNNLEKKEVEKQHWLNIKPVVMAMKEAFSKSWIYKVYDTPYDTNQASNLRDEEERKRDKWDHEQEIMYTEENEKYQKEAIQKKAEREKMTPEELDEDYRQTEEDYEDARMNEENLTFSRMSAMYYRPKSQCSSCNELLEAGNQGTICIDCIFQLGSCPMKM